MTSLQFKYFKKFLSLLLAFSLVAPAGVTLAQPRDLLDTASPGQLEKLNEWHEAAVKNSEDNQEQLRELNRQIDENAAECKPTSPGGGLAASLSQVISRGIQKNLSQLIKRSTRDLTGMVQKQMNKALPQVLERGMRRELPSALRQQMRSAGASQPTPAMVRQAILQILPQIIKQDLPDALEKNMATALRPTLQANIEKEIFNTSKEDGTPEEDSSKWKSPILDGDQLFQNNLLQTFGPESPFVKSFDNVSKITQQYIQKQADELGNAVISFGTGGNNGDGGITGQAQTAINALKQTPQVILQATIDQLKQNVALMTQDLVGKIQRELANEAARGVGQGEGVDALTQQILRVIMPMILNGMPTVPGVGSGFTGIMGQLNDQNLGSAFSQSSGSGHFDFQSWAGNDILAAAGFDFKPLSAQLAEPVALALVSGVGFSGFDKAVGNLAAMGYSGGTPDATTIRLASQLDENGANYLGALGSDAPGLSSEVVTAANAGNLNTVQGVVNLPVADWSGGSGSSVTNSIGSDAANSVKSGAGDIGSNVGNGISAGLSAAGQQVGADLVSGSVNAISGGVGSLVEGVPYVGGLLSTYAERITQVALVAALTYIGVPGWLVQDVGAGQTIASGNQGQTKALLKPLGKISGYEQTQVKQNQDAFKQREEEKDRIFRACMTMMKAMRAARALQNRADVDNPAAREKALLGVAKEGEKFQESSQTAGPNYNEPNGEGNPLVSDLGKNQADRSAEAIRQIVAAYQGGNQSDQTLANDVLVGTTVGRWDRKTISQSDMDRMANSPESLSSADFNRLFPQMLNPANTTRGTWLTIMNRALAVADEAKRRAEIEFIAYQGFEPIRICIESNQDQTCKTWKTLTPGNINAYMAAAYATAPVNAGINSHFYKEDTALAPFFQTSNTWLTGINNNQSGLGGNLPISDIFSNGLNDVVGDGLDNLFDQIDVNEFTSNLTSGWDSGGFTRSDLNNGGSFNLQSMVQSALQNTTGSSGFQPNEITQIVQAIIQAIITYAQNQNQT